MTAAPDRQVQMLERAMEYRTLGYPVFPVCSPAMGEHRHGSAACKNPGKRPLVSWEPFQTRLPTIEEVRSWWTRWPEANIGMATGALAGIVVLDADSGEAKKLAMEQGGVDQTPAVWTGKPGGIHFWLGHPGEEVSNFARKRPGLDFRGDGGYVLVPPSLHASGARYRWVDGTAGRPLAPVPPWLLALLHGESAAADAEPAREALDIAGVLDGVPEGGRDDALWRLACKLRSDDVPRQYAEALVRQAARACRPPFDEELAVEKVDRAYRRYEPEPTWSPGGDMTADGAPSAYPVVPVATLLDQREDEAPYIVERILWALRVTWLFSDPNSGKTLLMLAILLHVAAGREFHGHAVRQGAVLVIQEDSPLSVLAEYVENLADIYQLDLDALPFYVNQTQGLRITDERGVETVKLAIASCATRPTVVLFDACERLVPSDRFTTKELDPLTRLFQWCISERITPVMIDHTNKERVKKGEEKATPMERLYGARAKSAISDVMLYISGSLKGGSLRMQFEKFRGEAPPALTIGYANETGFWVKSDRGAPRSPAEQAVLKFFNNAPIREYPVAEVETETGLKRRTLERVLSAFARRGWILATGETRRRTYRINPAVGGVFS